MCMRNLKAFPLKTLLQALKDHPEGVDPGYFNNLKEEGVDLRELFILNFFVN
jgi:hypothetical protein